MTVRELPRAGGRVRLAGPHALRCEGSAVLGHTQGTLGVLGAFSGAFASLLKLPGRV